MRCKPGGVVIPRSLRPVGPDPSLPDTVFRGFVEQANHSVNSGTTTMRQFSFQKAELNCSAKDEETRDEKVSCDLGTIELKVRSGRMGPPRSALKDLQVNSVQSTLKTNERAAAKKGASVAVQKNSARVSEASKLTPYTIVDKREEERLSIKMYIREKRWLRSRLIVDAEGRPCTHAMASSMAKECAIPKSENEYSPPSKRAKLEPSVVIDLTT